MITEVRSVNRFHLHLNVNDCIWFTGGALCMGGNDYSKYRCRILKSQDPKPFS